MTSFLAEAAQKGGASAAAKQVTARASAASPANAQTLDDMFSRVSLIVPEFGGMFLGADGTTLQVYLTNPSARNVEAVKNAVLAVFGPDAVPLEKVRALKADYGFAQLRAWYQQMVGPVLGTPGVTMTDISEATNRLVVGVERQAVKGSVSDQVARLRIPSKAVVSVVTEPVRPVTYSETKQETAPPEQQKQSVVMTLQDAHSPREGGYTIRHLIPNGGGIIGCTLGFNVYKSGVPGFIAASGCTISSWVLDSPPTDFYQSPGYYPAEWAGTENADPSAPCTSPYPSSSICRYSDSVFIKYRPILVHHATLAHPIGVTIAMTNPNLQVANQVFPVVSGPTQAYLVGLQLNKVGSFGGWTKGPIASTCFDQQMAPGKVIRCQYLMGVYSGPPQTFAAGDGGSAIFRIKAGNYVELYGMAWGAAHYTGGGGYQYTGFSPIGGVAFQQSGILTDLGPIDYADDCMLFHPSHC
jgi:hypothetical protein